MTVRQRRVLEMVDLLALPGGSRVLDAGCGPGYLVSELAARGFRVCALDAAHEMVRVAQGRLSAAQPPFPPSFHLGSVEQLPFRPGSFDLVCSTGVIEYLQDDARILAEAYRTLRPGGYLVLSITNRWSPINVFEPAIEFLKRRRIILRALGERWSIRPRYFKVRRHPPARFREALRNTGFRLQDATYFHFLPWPRPLDRVFPAMSEKIGTRLERFGRSWIGPLAEGYLTISMKPGRDS